MIILGGAELQFTEGTTQGENVAMSFYSISTIQIQQIIRFCVSDVKQIWLVDDVTVAGSLKSLKSWYTNIVNEVDRFGYYVNEKESLLIVKNETPIEAANDLHKRNRINNGTNGKCHLGAAIDSNEFRVEYVTEKVDEWIDELVILSIYANRNRKLHMLLFVLKSRIRTVIFFVQYLL